MAAINAKKSSSQDVDAEGEEGEGELSWSPVAVRLPRKPAGRCLSALVKGLRNMEEEKLDEELEMLREMECEELGIPISKPKPFGPGAGAALPRKPRVQVQDSQIPDFGPGEEKGEVEMPLGADGEREGDESSESDAEQLGRDGRKLRVWKKKGQKRSTRRVVMRPTVGKWVPEKEWACGEDEEGKGEGVVRDTQVSGQGKEGEAGAGLEDGDDSESGEDGEGNKVVGKDGKGTVGKKAKKPKKVSATAHANFRALKIRNKQSKGKRGGRFGRRNK